MRLIDVNGQEVMSGEVLRSFRGEFFVFRMISREPEIGKTGKVLVHRKDDPAALPLEYYAHVFDCTIER